MRIRYILWNLMGLGLPLFMALIAIPGLLTRIGSERFGLLALAWGLIGYAGMLDLGIGRATTQRVSLLRNNAGENEIPDVVATAIRITTITGMIGMLIILLAALSGAYRFIHVETVPAGEIEVSMILLALALPMQAISATYRGVNEAYLNFRGINILRTALGVANFGAPYLVAMYTTEVYWLVATLVLSRFLALAIFRHLAYCCIFNNSPLARGKYIKRHAQNLLRFGGWFSITSIVGPIMVKADRFFVGVYVSATAVTLYVIPYEVTTQTLILAGALTTVIFPVVTNLLNKEPEQAMAVFHLWLARIVGVMFVVLSLLAYAMPTLLHLWVGERITEESVRVGQLLCVGVFFNTIGAMYFSLLHARGCVKQTAILHCIELPFYMVLLVYLIAEFGIIGCAVAWSIRATMDTLALILMSKKRN
ncbi:flippase [Desulfopila sp. IMCC35006]|uniref:oligosaccharide flippase family protein n=1 Tax=Desulfopila sp. IMCC35006 TaxID=2569542 RepID=UPI0010AD35B2|nr:oligosaccharide flippase family protein [Desulfopila sp. IMCC35006]TKB26135.1 flippase [Desulfopila sp. IMCC35006]